MKKDIHPKWYPQAKVVCSCGHTFTVGSIREEIQVEICSACHPLFTGQMKYVDTAGRVERFQKKQKAASGEKVLKKKVRRTLRRLQAEKEEQERPKSLKEMLQKKS